MKISKFDKVIWRINGVVILIGCVTALLFAAYGGYHIIKDLTRTRNVHNIVNVNSETKKEEYLSLGHFSITEENIFSAPLYSDESISRRSYSKSASSVRNYYYFNGDTAQDNWLLKNNNSLISERDEYTDMNPNSTERLTLGFVYTVIESDSNQDGVMSDSDLYSIYLSDIEGKGLKKITDKVEVIHGSEQISKNQYILFVLKNEKNCALYINLNTGSIEKSVYIDI